MVHYKHIENYIIEIIYEQASLYWKLMMNVCRDMVHIGFNFELIVVEWVILNRI